MLNHSRKSLSLSGGGIVLEEIILPSYEPNGGHFPWEEDINDINTPDIDPSFFNDNPFNKMSVNQIEYTEDKFQLLIDNTVEELSQQSVNQSLDDNVFIDLSQLINQSIPEPVVTTQSMVAPNEVFDAFIPSTTAPVLHYLQPNNIESLVSSVSIPVIETNTSVIDSISSQPNQELSQQSLRSSPQPSHSPLSRVMASPSSPAHSFTSNSSHTFYSPSAEDHNSDSNTIDSIEIKPDPSFLHPTVINDHLYTLPSTSSRKRKSSSDGNDINKYESVRKKNNMASKKSRMTKRDKQKMMDQQIHHYLEDNKKCKEMIIQMEKEIQWCKDYLFKKVTSTPRA